jgi:hypothetical protein
MISNFRVTPSGSILDLTADATGNMMTNVSWGFGNGSTTINVPDERAMFGRGAGVHGTLLKANGSSLRRWSSWRDLT